MVNAKITVPSNVADAIAHYVNLADSKHEAFTDILRLGFEAERSEIILRHFDHDYDELMQALICGYEVEQTPAEKIRDYYESITVRNVQMNEFELGYEAGVLDAIPTVLNYLGIKIDGINAC
jgi:DNA integrity scanning protein DisA with diadenylate cyclase activity